MIKEFIKEYRELKHERDNTDRSKAWFLSEIEKLVVQYETELNIQSLKELQNPDRKCELHFIDANKLYSWITLPPTLANEVNECPHCHFRLAKPFDPAVNDSIEDMEEEERAFPSDKE